MGHRWTPEEDAILRANVEKSASKLLPLLPNRSTSAIDTRKQILGISRKLEWNGEENFNRPLTEESAYQIRTEYAAKIRRGYTHEQAVKWLVEANMRYQHIIEDVLINPKYDAEVARCRRNVGKAYAE